MVNITSMVDRIVQLLLHVNNLGDSQLLIFVAAWVLIWDVNAEDQNSIVHTLLVLIQ